MSSSVSYSFVLMIVLVYNYRSSCLAFVAIVVAYVFDADVIVGDGAAHGHFVSTGAEDVALVLQHDDALLGLEILFLVHNLICFVVSDPAPDPSPTWAGSALRVGCLTPTWAGSALRLLCASRSPPLKGRGQGWGLYIT